MSYNNKKLFIIFLKCFKNTFVFKKNKNSFIPLIKIIFGPLMLILHEVLHFIFSFIFLQYRNININEYNKVIGFNILSSISVNYKYNAKSITSNFCAALSSISPILLIFIIPYLFGFFGIILLIVTFDYWFLSKKDTDNFIYHLKTILFILKNI